MRNATVIVAPHFESLPPEDRAKVAAAASQFLLTT